VSWQAQAWAIEVGKRYELDPGHRWMLTILANYADPEGNDIYPSIGTLMADTGFGENTIRRHIKHLMLCGLMEYGDQSAAMKLRPGNRPKVYRLTFTTKDPLRIEGSHIGGSQKSSMGGPKRGATVEPKPMNPKENLCRSCDRSRPASDLSDSGICADCLGIGPNAAAEGAAYREQLRLRRLAGSIGSMPA
jgi:hypothetical protein